MLHAVHLCDAWGGKHNPVGAGYSINRNGWPVK